MAFNMGQLLQDMRDKLSTQNTNNQKSVAGVASANAIKNAGQNQPQSIGDMYTDQQGKYNNELWSGLKNIQTVNPYTTDTAKTILNGFKYQGASAANNQLAGAGDNGGNIDSYAAANANRQQAAYTAKGNESVLNDYNNRMALQGQMYDRLGNNTQNLFSNSENQKTGDVNRALTGAQTRQVDANTNEIAANSQMARNQIESGITGYIPTDMATKNNIYLNPDGTLKSLNVDYQAIINDPNADATTKSMANQARNIKITGSPDYSRYADTMKAWQAPQTQAARDSQMSNDTANKQIDNNFVLGAQQNVTADKQVSNNYDLGIRGDATANNQIEASKQMNALDNATSRSNTNTSVSASRASNLEEAAYKDSVSRRNKQIGNINSQFNKDTYNDSKGKSQDIIVDNGDGSYSWSRDVSNRDAFMPPIIEMVEKNSNLSKEEKDDIYQQLGISQDLVNSTVQYLK